MTYIYISKKKSYSPLYEPTEQHIFNSISKKWADTKVANSKIGSANTAGQPDTSLNTWRPRRNGRYFPDDIFKYIFLNENVWISIKIWLTFVLKGPINNIPTFVQIMAWCRLGDKPLSEQMVVRLPTYEYVTRPHWVLNSAGDCIQWNLSVTTTPMIKSITCDLFSNVF